MFGMVWFDEDGDPGEIALVRRSAVTGEELVMCTMNWANYVHNCQRSGTLPS
jgi:hypothetical protein